MKLSYDNLDFFIGHFIVDQSRDLLETYSRQLIQLVKSQINNKN